MFAAEHGSRKAQEVAQAELPIKHQCVEPCTSNLSEKPLVVVSSSRVAPRQLLMRWTVEEHGVGMFEREGSVLGSILFQLSYSVRYMVLPRLFQIPHVEV